VSEGCPIYTFERGILIVTSSPLHSHDAANAKHEESATRIVKEVGSLEKQYDRRKQGREKKSVRDTRYHEQERYGCKSTATTLAMRLKDCQ
jgi:hypothetical protein